jgi:hypothetical protein
MTPPEVLLELSFLDALADPAHVAHVATVGCYTELLERYEGNELRLSARGDHLLRTAHQVRESLLAPVAPIHVAGQHRRQAGRLRLPAGLDCGLDCKIGIDLAITLVIMRRHRIARVATLHPLFDAIDVHVDR